jgi:uncharacterized protein YqfA (UPF0365 family)
MAELKINGDISGSTTITAPNTGTDETIELSTALASKLDIAGGKILQVVQTFKDNVFSTTSTSYVDVTGLSASITPSSESSKILVFLRTSQSGDGSAVQTITSLLRNSTVIAAAESQDYFSRFYPARTGSTDVVAYVAWGSTHLDYLDNPNTTSTVIYKLQMKVTSGTGYLNRGRDLDQYRGVSSITLMEVSA